MSQTKLSLLALKIADQLELTEVNDAAVDLVVKNMLLYHKEFARIPRDSFRASITETLQSKFSLQPVDTSAHITPAKVIINDTPQNDMLYETSSLLSAANGDGSRSVKEKKRKHSQITPKKESASFMELASTTVAPSPRPSTRLRDLAGLDTVLRFIQQIIFYPIQLPELYRQLGVKPPSCLLLHGPSGCGKSSLASAIAGELGLPYFKASGPELIGGTSGESETRVRELFEAALSNAPSIIFIDALDVIAGKSDSQQRGMDRRVIAQLHDSIDAIKNASQEDDDDSGNFLGKHVILIAATGRPEKLDSGVRGRFAQEVALPVPDAPARTKILQLALQKSKLAPDVDTVALGKMTPGYVGADLKALASEAGMHAVKRIVAGAAVREDEVCGDDVSDMQRDIRSMSMNSDDAPFVFGVQSKTYGGVGVMSASMSEICITMADFAAAIKNIQPSAKREGFAVVPDVTWKDVGALAEVREELEQNVLEPIAHPERFTSLGLDVPAGVLFFGPPGCGKTLLAKALANQSGANFISVKGPELLNKFVGESESRVRQVFARARASAPCVIFFDELDALCPKRGMNGDSGSGVSERVVNQLLTELDGVEVRKDVYIIAATNRLELIDDAMLRPGRLGKLLYVPLPSASDRASILRAVTRNVSLDSNSVDLNAIGVDERANGFSGADLASLVREAGLAVLNEWRQEEKNRTKSDSITTHTIAQRHFEVAFSKVRPSVSPEERARYDLVQHFIRDKGFGAIEALRAAREAL